MRSCVGQVGLENAGVIIVCLLFSAKTFDLVPAGTYECLQFELNVEFKRFVVAAVAPGGSDCTRCSRRVGARSLAQLCALCSAHNALVQ